MNNPPEEANSDSVTGLGKREAPTLKLVSAPVSCSYRYTIHKDLAAGDNCLVMETRASHNVNMVYDLYYQLGAPKLCLTA